MALLNCNCKRDCTLLAVVAAVILGIVAAFLQITGMITVTTAFLWVALGIAVVYLGVLLLTTALGRRANYGVCLCRTPGTVLTGILGAILLAVILLGWYILKYTRMGRFTYAIGGNESCAKLSGINLKKVKCFVYVVSGLCCGVAALLLSSRLDSAVPTNAEGQEMDAIAAVVIGGTSMSGGEGSMIGTLPSSI